MDDMADGSLSVTGTNAAPGAARVLIVEGHGHSREGLTDSLRGHGVGVETAAGYAEAMRKVKGGRFAVAIIDVDLPAERDGGLDGWGLARIIRARHHRAGVILVTAEWRPELGAEAERLRECCLLEKPINPAELCAMVRALQSDVA